MPASLGARYDTLYEKFADAWRVTDRDSLFDYAPGALREKLFGRGAHLTAPHPPAGYRHWLPHYAGDKVRADEHEPA